ncbi:type II secretion system secretin GspD [Vibrio marisflavi]|uniref:Secretin GspD n=1 Tax=Vibrio marisflavi CECT 7928 TaxID=634439 RepID=A0ABN8E8N8_9VIBR|nr:type II secretion system secretin GspD [Vibrio marisflavi]CAH0541867.1 Secretin GspD [Vibrio marisflavi CECT 7928]
MKRWLNKGTWLLILSLLAVPTMAMANEFSVNFKGTDIQEFIDSVGRNLGKTIIIDPSVRGKIDVRSYDPLNEKQYYSLFLNVLETYGFAAVTLPDGVVKVIKAKDAKTASVPVLVGNDKAKFSDEVITRVVTVHNVSVRELSPILRQLIDNAGAGNVVHYEPSNIILITGRADTVNKLVEIIRRVDKIGDKNVQVIELKNANASDVVRTIDSLIKSNNSQSVPTNMQPKLVADDRTNSILISGSPEVRERLVKLIEQLDVNMISKGKSQVVYLKYAKAEDVVKVLQGVAKTLEAEKAAKGTGKSSAADVSIEASKSVNALVITAPPDIMKSLKSIIKQLDIRRAQVLIEALIVEMSESQGIKLGVQWGSLESGSVVQFGNTGVPIGGVMTGLEDAKDQTETYISTDGTPYTSTTSGSYDNLASALSGVNGAAVSLMMGDWTALISAISTDSNANILSSPSIMVLDNSEADFIVGEEVPVVTGSTAGSNNSNPFQTVSRKEVGIKLKVTPQINEGNAVKLTIQQEVSNVLPADGAVDVRFAKRQLNTVVMVNDGQMLVLGGLIDERAVESKSKVPLLGDIPIIGALFRSTSTSMEKKNLMVFIKPTIIRTGVAADGVTERKYNYIRAEQLYKADEGLDLLKNSNIPVLPKYGDDGNHPPELQAIIDQVTKTSKK